MKNIPLLRLFIAALFVFAQLLPAAPVQARPSPSPAAQSLTNFKDAQMVDGIIYFLYFSPTEIKRYDTASQAWLSPIPLPATPTAFLVNDSEILVALGKTIARYNLDGTGKTDFWTGEYPVLKIVADSQFVFACQQQKLLYNDIDILVSIPRATGAAVESLSQNFACDGLSIASGVKKLFARSRGMYPADILFADYDDQGLLPDHWVESPHHGDFPEAQKTWVFPDESSVIEDTSVVYSTDGLNYVTSLLYDTETNPSHITDLAFVDNVTVILRSGILTAYNQQLIDFGTYTPSYTPSRILSAGDTIYAVRDITPLPVIEAIPLSSFQTYSSADPIDAYGFPYTIDELAFDPEGEIIYLMSTANRQIFRWSVEQRAYLAPIPLVREPANIAYSPEAQALYIAYKNGLIDHLKPEGIPGGGFFAIVDSAVTDIVAIGNSLLVAAKQGSGDYYPDYLTLNASGQKVSGWSGYVFPPGQPNYVWGAAKGRLYYSNPGNSNLYWYDFSPAGEKVSENSKSNSMIYEGGPLRVSGDETRLFIHPRLLLDVSGETPTELDILPAGAYDAAWIGETLFTLHNTVTAASVQKWNADLTPAEQYTLLGAPTALLPTSEGVLAITQHMGRPRFTLLDSSLKPIYAPPAVDFSAEAPKGGSPLTVKFTNLSENNEGATYLWDFGDGETSTDANPEHTYTVRKKYTVTLTATGAAGSDRAVKKDFVTVYHSTYLPLSQVIYPVKSYANACKTFPMYVIGYGHAGTMTECVTKIEDRGNWRVFFTWKPDLNDPSLCIDKRSDFGNARMYMTDQYGGRYDMVNAGDAALAITCMVNKQAHLGWFEFPKRSVTAPIFTFHDDDNNTLIGPVAAP